jgi:hypothetical protein
VSSSLAPFAVGLILGIVNAIAAVASCYLPETTGLQLGLLDEVGSMERLIEGNENVRNFGESYESCIEVGTPLLRNDDLTDDE